MWPGLFYKHLCHSLINWLIDSLSNTIPPNLQNTFTLKPWKLRTWNVESRFTSLHLSYVRCHMSLIFLSFFSPSDEASCSRVCYQWGLPCLVSMYDTEFLKAAIMQSHDCAKYLRIRADFRLLIKRKKRKNLHKCCVYV